MRGRILIVDNAATNRIVLKVKLSGACHEVIQASHGREALTLARTKRPDLILMDATLDDIDGVTACRALKDTPATADIPVILITGQGDFDLRLRGLAAGADEFLTKPVQEATLLARVRSLLRAGDILRELRDRNRTYRDLGFAEEPAVLQRPSWVVLVGDATPRSNTLRTHLEQSTSHRVCILNREDTLSLRGEAGGTVTPDVFVLMPSSRPTTHPMAALTELRSNSAARHAGIIAMIAQGQDTDAAMALDLGANDILHEPADPEELTLRIELQLRRKQRADQLRATVSDGLKQAVLDPLTGLYNRRYALHHLGRIAQQSHRHDRPFAVVMLDVDRFKSVNDGYGHPAGDCILRDVAQRLRGGLRPVDLISRFGGEEFLIALPESNAQRASDVADRLRRLIAETPFQLPDDLGKVQVTISAGIAIGGRAHNNCEHLIAQADRALYASKSDGRNAVTLSETAA